MISQFARRSAADAIPFAARGIASSTPAKWIRDLSVFESVKEAPDNYESIPLAKFKDMVDSGPKRAESVPEDWKAWVKGAKADKTKMFAEWSSLFTSETSNTDPVSLTADPSGKKAANGRRGIVWKAVLLSSSCL